MADAYQLGRHVLSPRLHRTVQRRGHPASARSVAPVRMRLPRRRRRVNVVIKNRKQYKQAAAIWWRCACGCTYGTIRADSMDVCDQAVARIADTSDCRSQDGAA